VKCIGIRTPKNRSFFCRPGACNHLWPRDGRRQRNLSLNQGVFIKQGQLPLARCERAPCIVTRVELWRQAAALTSYRMWECWQSPRLAFPVPWQQCRGLKIFFERRIAGKSPNRSSTALQKREATGKKSGQAIWPHAPETKSTAPPPEDQHPISEMESLTEEDKNRGRERNGSRPNRQPKQGLFAVCSLN